MLRGSMGKYPFSGTALFQLLEKGYVLSSLFRMDLNCIPIKKIFENHGNGNCFVILEPGGEWTLAGRLPVFKRP